MTLNQLVQTWESELDKASDSLLIENPIKYSQLKNYIFDMKKTLNDNHDNSISVDKQRHEITIDNKIHIFPKKIFKMINYFLDHPNKCITRDELLRNCWEEGVVVGNRTIDVHICKIKNLTNRKINIVSQKGVGYRYKI